MKEDPRLFSLWLSLAVGPASRLTKELFSRFQTPEAAYACTEEDLASFSPSLHGRKDALLNKDLSAARGILSFCKENGVRLLSYGAPDYPDALSVLENPPCVLYAKGDLSLLSGRFAAAVVGSRRPSAYGAACTKRIAYDLAGAGAVLISGLAAGVDALAHRAALLQGGGTAAVLGCGIDRVYPAENAPLYEEIAEKGLLLTEYAPGTPPLGSNFPRRNRLIAALSHAVLVMEGSDKSGSLITAEEALRQKKALYSVPGSIFARGSAGSNFLLKLGAKPLLSPYEVLSDFQDRFPELHAGVLFFEKERDRVKKEALRKTEPDGKVKIKKEIASFVFSSSGKEEEKPKRKRARKTKEAPPEVKFTEIDPEEPEGDEILFSLTPEERALFDRIPETPVPQDALLGEGMSAAALLRSLTKFEILGLVSRLPGGKIVRRPR